MSGRPCFLLTLLLIIVSAASPASSSATGADAPPACEAAAETLAAAVPDSLTASEQTDRVVVCYFHRTARCTNCLRFETYAEEALRRSFAPELSQGVLEWRVINLDDSASSELVGHYDLYESSLIVSIVRDGEETDWNKLDGIWYFVGDKDKFVEYVASEVAAKLACLRGPDENAR